MALDGTRGNSCRKCLDRQEFPGQEQRFYRQILGIFSPWKVVSVELTMKAKQVAIAAEVDRYQRITQLLPQAIIKGLRARGHVTTVAEFMRLDWQMVNQSVRAAIPASHS